MSVIVWRGDDSGEREPGAIEQRTKLYARGVSRYDAACDCAVAVIPEDTAWEAEAAELFGALGF
ncbi:MAG: hypothetical protein H6737_13820 [Alphaproteobacteria bacterium]|nr:hypothetical protein [Alphaproteobacteria bacterium]